MDNTATDIALARGFEGGNGFAELGAGSHSATSSIYQGNYSHHYRAIGRANSLLQNMERAKDVTAPEKYSQIQAQALALRAYHYMNLTELYGDVPLVLQMFASTEESLVPRDPKETVVNQILSDLDEAVASLPDKWSGADIRRITKGAALALKSRIALYNKKYTEAAAAAKAIMDDESAMGYSLNPSYEALFGLTGEGSPEIMLPCL